MKKKLLVADDDEVFQSLIGRIFAGSDWEVSAAGDGVSALEKINTQTPDVILLDLNMPKMGGRDLLGLLRRDARFAMIPVIIISGDDTMNEKVAEFGIGADDFLVKPFDARELSARVDSACRRARRMLTANPLTMLPGGPAIEEEAAARIKSGFPVGFFYIDIDNFKAYNDNYGYLSGDNAIKQTAYILTSVQGDFAEADIFVGHIGGDDFVMMCDPAMADEVAESVASRFDAMVPKLYKSEDVDSMGINSRDRTGNIRKFPLMSLSISIATNERRRLEHYAKLVDIVSEIKKYLKGRGRAGSAYMKDRRVDKAGDAG